MSCKKHKCESKLFIINYYKFIIIKNINIVECCTAKNGPDT